MSQNPYSPSPNEAKLQLGPPSTFWWQSRFIFLLAAFSSAVIAFYCGLAENVFSTPYLEPHIGVPMFTSFIYLAVGFAAACTAVIGIASLYAGRIQGWHYGLLFIPFMIEFLISWCFFVAFFGV